MHEFINIDHTQIDDTVATFYCVRRMPNGNLGTARTEISIEAMDNEDKESQKLIAWLVFNDLVYALKLLRKT